MSKITISAVLTVLRLVVSLTGRVLHLLYSVVDLVDDGCLNSSVTRPVWLETVFHSIDAIQLVLSRLQDVSKDVSSYGEE